MVITFTGKNSIEKVETPTQLYEFFDVHTNTSSHAHTVLYAQTNVCMNVCIVKNLATVLFNW